MNIWVLAALAFAAAAGLVAALAYALTASSRRIGRRVESLSRGAAERKDARGDRFASLNALLEHAGEHSAIEQRLDRAGINWRPGEFLALWLGVIVLFGAGGWALLGPLGAAVGVAIAAAGAFGILRLLEARRLRAFERQLPDALMLIASSLRSGYGILHAMQAVRDEMKPPISLEFGRTLDETKVGAPTADALLHLVRRVPLPDLDIAVTAILIQLDTGGNLAQVMEIVASTVRERQRIRAEVNTLTAEGRMSGVILFILPLAMAVILQALNPSYMSALFKTTLGHLLLITAGALQVMGGLIINRMLRVDF